MRHVQHKQTKQQNNNERIGLLLKLPTLYKLMTMVHLRTW